MRSNAGMANRQGGVDFLFSQVSALQSTLWLGLAAKHQSEGVLCQTHEAAAIQFISKETMPDRPATMPRGPYIPLFSRAGSSSFRPRISTSQDPWQFTLALLPSPPAHRSAHHIHAICLCSTLHHKVARKSFREAAHWSRQDQCITIRQLQNYMNLRH
jgi:hypothetical protein